MSQIYAYGLWAAMWVVKAVLLAAFALLMLTAWMVMIPTLAVTLFQFPILFLSFIPVGIVYGFVALISHAARPSR